MTNPTIKIHNVETNKILEREMNAKELAQLEIDKARQVEKLAAAALAATARAALLEKLGITSDEAALLLS
tara:strand:+ start:485 stop:694 length:210 start_codon:yes stop_codon:yes gene_type:complete